MKHWTAIEQQWRDQLLDAMIPGLQQLELDGFWTELGQVAPPLLRFGLRAAVWGVTFLPIPAMRTLRTFSALEPEEQDRLLRRLNGSNRYLLRQLVMTLKVMACFAHMRDERCRSKV